MMHNVYWLYCGRNNFALHTARFQDWDDYTFIYKFSTGPMYRAGISAFKSHDLGQDVTLVRMGNDRDRAIGHGTVVGYIHRGKIFGSVPNRNISYGVYK